MLTVHELLHDALTRIEQEGKTPTVALVKSRLSTPVPMPAIIQAVKAWKSGQAVPKINIEAKAPLSDSERINALEKQVAELQQQLSDLQQRLDLQP